MANTYDTGDRVAINTSTVFQDSGGNAFDPAKVTFTVKDPSGTETPYVYDQDGDKDPAITKNDVGDYTLTIDVDAAGAWYVRIDGEEDDGENRGADEIYFNVFAF